jgi:hypothetical protein
MDRRDRRAQAFLILVAAVFIPLFALPLFIDPYWWGYVFGWDTGSRSDLTAYLGRCLGAVALAIAVVALLAAREPTANRGLFDVLILGGGAAGARAPARLARGRTADGRAPGDRDVRGGRRAGLVVQASAARRGRA